MVIILGSLISGVPHYDSMEPVGNWYSTSRASPLPSPHLDKRFFDCSLIEMKSQASSTSTLDYDSMDEVWIKRNDTSITPETVRRKKVFTNHFLSYHSCISISSFYFKLLLCLEYIWIFNQKLVKMINI